MTDIERLHRSYQRLMWAYPRWYRQERGAEMITTLLDDVAPGQRRPARVDVVDLLAGGLRARLRPPRGLVAYLAAVAVGLYVAVAGAAVAALLGGHPGPPSDAQAIAAAAQAVPVQPRNVPGPVVHCDIICPFWDGHDDVVAFAAPPDRTDRTVVYFPVPWEDAPAVAAQARDRLIAAGWDVSPLRIQADGVRHFDASKDGLQISLTAWVNTPDAATVSSPVSMTVSKAFSAAAAVDLLTGLVGGLLAGWLTAAWALQRFRRHPLRHRLRIAAAAGPLLVIAPLTTLAGVMFAVVTATQGPSAKIVKTPLIVIPGLWWPVTVAAALSAVTALALAALPDRGGQLPPGPTRSPVPKAPA